MADPVTGKLFSGLVTQDDIDFYNTHKRRDVLSMQMPGESDNSSGFAEDGFTENFGVYRFISGVAMPSEAKPSKFDTPPDQLDFNEFVGWHSYWQAAYLKKFDAAGLPPRLTFTSGGKDFHVYLQWGLQEGVYILEMMDKQEVMKMPRYNIRALGDDIPRNYFTSIGLATDIVEADFSLTYSAEKVATLANLALARAAMNTATSSPDKAYTVPDSAKNMSQADRKLFTDELDLLNQTVEDNPFLQKEEVANKLNAIWERYKLAASFAIQETSNLGKYTTSLDDGVRWGYFSQDSGATVSSGYKNIIKQQKAILTLAQAAQELAKNPTPALFNAPKLIFMFQLYANQIQEAEIAVTTEEIKQLNALITTYNLMQKMVSDTIKAFASGDKPEVKRGLINVDDTEKVTMSKEGKGWLSDSVPVRVSTVLSDRIAMMFDSTNDGRLTSHPLETLFDVKRPQQAMVYVFQKNSTTIDTACFANDLNTKEQWTKFGDQLSAAVTQLNQQSQILSDRINQVTKTKDRHFDLGNNTLSKMSDMIQSIGRNIA